jgi:hypothetical protein
MASAWVALVNGQPLFMADTSAYVRGPDFAVVYLFGNKFATTWTQDRTLQGSEAPALTANTGSPVHSGSLDSPFDKAVLAGRSIYYGALLYISHLTSDMWLSVFAQAAIFLYLSYTFVIKCLRLSFFTFVYTTSITLVATPVSFFISFLMPDVFASFLILATIILTGFWGALKLRDKIFVAAIILYSSLVHTSHLLLLICLGLLFSIVYIITERKAILSGSIPKHAIVLFALILSGFLGELAFSYGIWHEIGADPVRPPFIMARVIADGPGYQFLQKNCATKPYVICNYIGRLPTPSGAFLWSMDPNEGIFSVADLATRRALSSEQASFVFDVFRSDPSGLITSAARNLIRQLLRVGLNEFFPDQQQLQSFKGKLPEFYFNKLLRSPIIFRDWILALGNDWYSIIYFMSMIVLVVTCALGPFVQARKELNFFPIHQWFYVLTIAIMGVIFNAAICGVLSEPAPRYQTRVSWIPSFILALLIVKLCEAFWSSRSQPALAAGKTPGAAAQFSATAIDC